MKVCPRCGYHPHDKRKLKRQIKKLLKEGLTQTEIGLYLELSQGYVSKIINGKAYVRG